MRYSNTPRQAILLPLLGLAATAFAQEPTYAERLGFPRDKKVLILHVDDAGMSWDSNEGVRQAIGKGVANSVSVMMPCPWVPDMVDWLKANPQVDAGLHLTLTSEWDKYRWGPLAGKPAVPNLVDKEGALWPSVEDVVRSAPAEEVDREIRAQLERARTMGFNPTHLDSHMGTLFAKPELLQKYVALGIAERIPVMFPGGHNTAIGAQMQSSDETRQMMSAMGRMIWEAGLPVLDDLHNVSYDWEYPAAARGSEAEMRRFATAKYIETIKALKPGLTMVIMHCTWPTEAFRHISDSGPTRKGDLLTMLNPEFRAFLEKEGIMLTTWREVMERRAGN
jgi:hypothetical protein